MHRGFRFVTGTIALWWLAISIAGSAAAQETTPLPVITPQNAAQIARIGVVDTGATGASYAWSPDGRLLAITAPGEVRLYDPSAPDAEPLRLPVSDAPDGYAPQFAFVPGTDRLITYLWGEAESVQVWDVASGTLVGQLDVGDRRTFNVTIGGGRIALYVPYAATTSIVQVWDIAHVAETEAREASRVFDLLIAVQTALLSPDGRWLATVTAGETARILQVWAVDTGELVAEEVSDFGYSALRFTPQGDALLFIDEFAGNTTLVSVPAFEDRLIIDTPYLGEPAIPLSPDGLTLVAPEGGEVIGLALIDLRSGGPLVSFGDANVNYPDRFAFGLGGQLFAYGTAFTTALGGYVRVWDVYKGEMAIEIPVAPPEPESPFAAADVRPVAFTPDGRVLLVEVHRFGNDPYRLHLYDVATGDLLADLALDLDENLPLAAVTLSPDGSAIALSYGGAFCCTAEFGTRQVEWWAVR